MMFMHMDKIAHGAESGLLQHNSRQRYNNPQIDSNRTFLNYNLTVIDGRTDMQRFKDRLAQCSYRKQKNNVCMESIVITAPKNMAIEDMPLFFKTAHRALQGLTGGACNEVSSYVHMDEAAAHMHYAFVPAIMIDGTLKLSAKRLMDRQKLRELHPTVQEAVNKAFGHNNYRVMAEDPAERGQTSDTLQIYKTKRIALDNLARQEKAEQATLALLKQQQDKLECKTATMMQEQRTAEQRTAEQRKVAKQAVEQTQYWKSEESRARQTYSSLSVKNRELKEELDSISCLLFSKQQDLKEQQEINHNLQVETQRLREEYKEVTGGVFREQAIAILRNDPIGEEWWAWAVNKAAMNLSWCDDNAELVQDLAQQELEPVQDWEDREL